MWELAGKEGSVHDQSWSKYDSDALVKDEIEIVLQINGKVRDKLVIPSNLTREQVEEQALKNEKIKAETQGKNVVKVITVPGKLVNIVVK